MERSPYSFLLLCVLLLAFGCGTAPDTLIRIEDTIELDARYLFHIQQGKSDAQRILTTRNTQLGVELKNMLDQCTFESRELTVMEDEILEKKGGFMCREDYFQIVVDVQYRLKVFSAIDYQIEEQWTISERGQIIKEWQTSYEAGMHTGNRASGLLGITLKVPAEQKRSMKTLKSSLPNTWFKNTSIPISFQPSSDTVMKPKMISIEGGKFTMGNTRRLIDHKDSYRYEKPPHSVWMPDFEMAETEVTNAQYCAFLNAKGSGYFDVNEWIDLVLSSDQIHFDSQQYQPVEGYADHPVANVSWKGALAYCYWLGPDYRLPSEAEWEYAAGGGKNFRHKWAGTAQEDSLDQYGVFDQSEAAPVRSKKPNPLGLYDLSGNVYEWCMDSWEESYEEAPTDGSAKVSWHKEFKVLRGGCWSATTNALRVCYRGYKSDHYQRSIVGFRPVRRPASFEALYYHAGLDEPYGIRRPASSLDGPLDRAEKSMNRGVLLTILGILSMMLGLASLRRRRRSG